MTGYYVAQAPLKYTKKKKEEEERAKSAQVGELPNRDSPRVFLAHLRLWRQATRAREKERKVVGPKQNWRSRSGAVAVEGSQPTVPPLLL